MTAKAEYASQRGERGSAAYRAAWLRFHRGRALRTGRPVWVVDTSRSPIFAGTPALDVMIDARSRAVASVPIMSPDGWLIGMISTHHPRRFRWSDR